MKESQVYLNFFKTNFRTILISTHLITAASLFYYSTIPSTYVASRIYEFPYNGQNLSQQIALSDTAVTLTRSLNIQQQLNLDNGVELKVTKIAPVVIKTDVESTNPQLVTPNMEKISSFLVPKYSLTVSGVDTQFEHQPNPWLFILVGLGVGFSLGILISLIRIYFKKY